MGRGLRRYSPRSLVTVSTCGTCSAGPFAMTVTPGRIAPELSVTTPMIAACVAWPAEGVASAKNPTRQIEPMMNLELTDRRTCFTRNMCPLLRAIFQLPDDPFSGCCHSAGPSAEYTWE